MAPPVTLTQLAERIDGVRAAVDRIETNVKQINDQALDRRVTKLEDTVRWLGRLLAGALVSAAGSIVVTVLVASR